VAVVFGCWTSASRKAVLPVFEQLKGLLFYPVQYEGLEMSPNIFYTGATTNQQIVPAVDYLIEQKMPKMFLLGSDYVFPRTANDIIKAQLKAKGGELAGEEYTPLGHTDYATVITKIKSASPQVVFNALNGDSNVAFFKQLKDAGITSDKMQTLSVSVAEEEVRGIRRRQHAEPSHRLELFPDDRHSEQQEVRGRVQGEVRRQPRHRRSD
jgi:urea transport system substrate-binding protein